MFNRSASVPLVDVPVANLGRISLPESATPVAEVEEVNVKVAALHDQPPAAIVEEMITDAERLAGLRLLTEARDTAGSLAAALYGSLFNQIPTPGQITAAADADTHTAALTHLVDRATTAHIPADRWTPELKAYVTTTAGRINGLPPLPASLFETAMANYHDALRRNLPNITPPRSTDADLAAEHASAAYTAARAGHSNVPALVAGLVHDTLQGHRHPLEVITYLDSYRNDVLPALLAEHAAALELIAAADTVRHDRGLA